MESVRGFIQQGFKYCEVMLSDEKDNRLVEVKGWLGLYSSRKELFNDYGEKSKFFDENSEKRAWNLYKSVHSTLQACETIRRCLPWVEDAELLTELVEHVFLQSRATLMTRCSAYQKEFGTASVAAACALKKANPTLTELFDERVKEFVNPAVPTLARLERVAGGHPTDPAKCWHDGLEPDATWSIICSQATATVKVAANAQFDNDIACIHALGLQFDELCARFTVQCASWDSAKRVVNKAAITQIERKVFELIAGTTDKGARREAAQSQLYEQCHGYGVDASSLFTPVAAKLKLALKGKL